MLLVEDNEINQQVAREILEGADLIVTVANNGQEAVDAVKTNAYDAVLMDVQMPVMDGYTATKAIRKWEGGMRNEIGKNSGLKSAFHIPNSEFKGLPIIAMTAHAMAGDEDKSLQAGMNGHVTKPIDPDQLFATLQQWIRPVAERTGVQKPTMRDTSVPSGQAASREDALPGSLPGFDLEAGLSRLMGNKRLYRKLLLDFGADYGKVADQIREAVIAHDFNGAHSLVHNLKGLAGNLAATGLQAAAVAMEKLVKGQTAETVSDKELNRQLTELQHALEQALDAVRTLGPVAEKKTVEGIGDPISSIPPELARKAADRIKAAAEMGDVMLVASIAGDLQAENDLLTPICDQITRLSEDFDLDGILKLAKELGGTK